MYNSYSPHNSINLKGIIIGNPYVDDNTDSTPGLMKLLWSHALIDYEWYNKLVADCDNFNNWDSEACNNDTDYIQLNLLSNLNFYNIYGDCFSQNGFVPPRGIIPPCAGWEGSFQYFLNQTVRIAFNIPDSIPPWAFCIFLDYTEDLVHGSLYVFPFLIRAGLRIWVYSGDCDGGTPFIGTREWISSLNLPIKQKYTSWYVDDQVAGFYIEYEGLTFITVKGGGHNIPEWKRPEAWHMIRSFLDGISL
mmetsp:Transcript_12623/g.12702  ORF Transcript_12623/g.12702 Transcript_12623/m.12702 type:complete len:248 (+) Transcript_12623:560-1303(+)